MSTCISTAKLKFPPAIGQSGVELSIAGVATVSFEYSTLNDTDLDITSAGLITVNFTGISNAIAVYLVRTSDGSDDWTLTVNGSSAANKLVPGGKYIVEGTATNRTGITSITVNAVGAGKLMYWIFG